MEHTKTAHQITGFQSIKLDRSIVTMNMLRQHTEQMVNLLRMEGSSSLSEEGRKFVSEWIKAYKKGYDDFGQAAEGQGKKIEAWFNIAGRPDPVDTENTQEI